MWVHTAIKYFLSVPVFSSKPPQYVCLYFSAPEILQLLDNLISLIFANPRLHCINWAFCCYFTHKASIYTFQQRFVGVRSLWPNQTTAVTTPPQLLSLPVQRMVPSPATQFVCTEDGARPSYSVCLYRRQFPHQLLSLSVQRMVPAPATQFVCAEDGAHPSFSVCLYRRQFPHQLLSLSV